MTRDRTVSPWSGTCSLGRGRDMGGYRDFWKELDRKVAKHTSDLERVKALVKAAKGSGVEVHPITFMWRCRLKRPGAASSEVFRAMTAEALLAEIGPVLDEIEAFRIRVQEEKARLSVPASERAKVRGELVNLRASRFRIRKVGTRPDRTLEWSCVVRNGSHMAEPKLLVAESAESLIALVRNSRKAVECAR